MAERGLIAAITELLGPLPERVLVGPGDDASVVRPAGLAVTSVDTQAEGVHFDRATHSPADIGAKAAAAALSDMAAMGTGADEAYVSLALPDDLTEADALALARGLIEEAAEHDCAVAGGDVVGARSLVVSVTVVGWAAERPVRRSGAGAGDVVGVTGALGASGAGLLCLQGRAPAGLDPAVRQALERAHRRPTPRIEAGRALAAAGVSAMIDISDGLATDAGHLAEAGGVALALELDAIPLAPGVAEAAGEHAAAFAATAGEDYELLFCVEPGGWERARAAVEAAGVAATRLGLVENGSGVRLLDADGTRVEGLRGYEHG